jgi:hypothetical protein
MQSLKIDLKDFPWGKVAHVHEVGEYQIVEYHPRVAVGCTLTKELHDHTEFHPYINGKNTSTSYRSLDAALVGVIAHKHDGANTRADVYFCRMVGIQ